jgi:hypothetical protein
MKIYLGKGWCVDGSGIKKGRDDPGLLFDMGPMIYSCRVCRDELVEPTAEALPETEPD